MIPSRRGGGSIARQDVTCGLQIRIKGLKMKKVALCLALVFLVTAASASAWDILRKDYNYTPCLEMSIVGNVIHGQATLAGSPSFPAPITGYFHGGKVYLSIAYLGEGAGE